MGAPRTGWITGPAVANRVPGLGLAAAWAAPVRVSMLKPTLTAIKLIRWRLMVMDIVTAFYPIAIRLALRTLVRVTKPKSPVNY